MGGKFIVAIGSSAGGLEPLKIFFDHTPSDNATYVILRHLPWEYESSLNKILERHSNLQVIEARDGMALENDKVYVLPSKNYMTVSKNILSLFPRNPFKPYPNRSIDIFLESMAEEKKCDCIAVILSGGGTDGVKGIKRVKESGGMVIAQAPDSAEHPSMPMNAIASGNVDHILFPSKMPEKILTHIKLALKDRAK